jgi:uncharacterized protein YmfQ (DUF2313 family)
MSNLVIKQLNKLTRQLFPQGRAYRIAKNSVKEKIVNALVVSESNFVSDADSVLNHILPDNDGFTVYDALIWEQRLGINSNPSTSLEDRKAAIIQKLNHPGNILARQSAGYLEQQLRLAGFDVYVHDNNPVLTIQQVLTIGQNLPQLGNFQLGQNQLADAYSVYSTLFELSQLGNFQLGQHQLGQKKYKNIVANKIDSELDKNFLWQNINRTFFIGGENLGEFADVDASRKDEFRQLILQLKPARTISLLLINYI